MKNSASLLASIVGLIVFTGGCRNNDEVSNPHDGTATIHSADAPKSVRQMLNVLAINPKLKCGWFLPKDIASSRWNAPTRHRSSELMLDELRSDSRMSIRDFREARIVVLRQMQDAGRLTFARDAARSSAFEKKISLQPVSEVTLRDIVDFIRDLAGISISGQFDVSQQEWDICLPQVTVADLLSLVAAAGDLDIAVSENGVSISQR